MKKKILFIIWSYTFGGGAESLLTSIVNYLNPQKYDIDIIEYHHEEIKKEPVNNNIHILPCIQAQNKLKRRFQTFRLYVCPQTLVNQYIGKDYDLYIAFNYLTPSFLLPKGTKNIVWMHGSIYDLAEKKSIWKRKEQDMVLYNVQKIVTISDLTEKSVIELYPQHKNKIVKIYNGIDTEAVREKALENTCVKLEKGSLLFIGRLDAGKDPVRLINVLKLVHEKKSDVHLYFLGTGEKENNVINQAKKLDLAEYVHMLGYHQNPFPIIKQCDIVCLLSKLEGFSMCLLESVSLGKPFVATNVGGAKELSNGQRCGRVIDTDKQAAEAICDLLNSNKSEIVKECQNSIERFEFKNYIKQIQELFDDVIENKYV